MSKFTSFEDLVDHVVEQNGTANIPRDTIASDIEPALESFGKSMEQLNHEVMLKHAAKKPNLQPGYRAAMRAKFAESKQ